MKSDRKKLIIISAITAAVLIIGAVVLFILLGAKPSDDNRSLNADSTSAQSADLSDKPEEAFDSENGTEAIHTSSDNNENPADTTTGAVSETEPDSSPASQSAQSEAVQPISQTESETSAVSENSSKPNVTAAPMANETPSTAAPTVKPTAALSAGRSEYTLAATLTETGSGYEGTKGTGKYNYGEALQKAVLFYELQRSGDIDESTARTNWRGDSGLMDGSDNVIDLTGGLYDAGDNAKFNLPMAYSAAMLAWSVYEDKESYKESKQYDYIMDTIRWVNDYLIKCHPEDDVYYYQVGSGSIDHSWWGASEVMQMQRPSYKVDMAHPGSAVSAEAAASLAAAAVVFKDVDKAYSTKCLSHAKTLYSFAEKTKSDAGYTQANGFYDSWSGFYDELSWAGAWLYIATGDSAYLDKADTYLKQSGGNYKWTMCWDDVYCGAALLLAKTTGKSDYCTRIEKNLNFWAGIGGEKITYTPKGLAWLDSWGSLRYATTAAFLAAVYSECEYCPADIRDTYWDFAVSQINYALGDTGRSFVVGFGENSPVHPHHRTSQGSWSDNMGTPSEARHTLYGALVGGPGTSDNYTDVVSDFNCNEVADDYNAGFVGVLAKMYSRYGGQTLKNFGAVEPVGTELYVEAGNNASGNDFTEIKAIVYNTTGWPARVTDNLELRYYVDLSEGADPSSVQISCNYMQGGAAGKLTVWDKDKSIYYVPISFDGYKIYPGGQSAYKCEVQFRIRSTNGIWDTSNDPSYKGITGSNGSVSVSGGQYLALYEDGKLVYGVEPKSGSGKGSTVLPAIPSNSSGSSGNNPSGGGTDKPKPVQQTGTASSGDLQLSVDTANEATTNTITINFDITNTGSKALKLSDLSVKYYFTKDGSSELTFTCDHSAVQNSDQYNGVDGISGAFSSASKTNADTCLTMSVNSDVVLMPSGVWKIQARVNKSDWSSFSTANDYSAIAVENIIICSDGKTVFGKEP